MPTPLRYVVVGAGAVGGAIGGRLHQYGHDVVLVARGAHHDALARDGLLMVDPDARTRVQVPVVGRVEDLDWDERTVALLTVKGQDSEAVLRDLAVVARPDTAVLCVQNGVDNERQALRRFARVYGVIVQLPASHVVPGEVILHSAPTTGLLDLGRYPHGRDELAERIAADLRSATFTSVADPDIMRAKRAKLLSNLDNAVVALCGPGAAGSELVAEARREAAACFAAAGLAVGYGEDLRERGRAVRTREVDGRPRDGTSTWLSLRRGTGSVETDFLNGEVVLAGRLHGVPTPVNEVLQRATNAAARRRSSPAPLSLADLEALVRAGAG
ncbi:MAG: ketopantoate reductase family protein [Acidimicrobiia bacterium]